MLDGRWLLRLTDDIVNTFYQIIFTVKWSDRPPSAVKQSDRFIISFFFTFLGKEKTIRENLFYPNEKSTNSLL